MCCILCVSNKNNYYIIVDDKDHYMSSFKLITSSFLQQMQHQTIRDKNHVLLDMLRHT